MFNFKNKEQPLIEYWPLIDGLDDIEESCPILYKNLQPSWWKNIPPFSETNFRSAKNCPSFSDMFSSAYVIRMWCDVDLDFRDNEFRWKTPHPFFKIEYHANDQFLSFAPENLRNSCRGVLKFISPWMLKTTKGYSTYQMPMTYDFNKDFTILPGIIHTDVYHSTNLQVLIMSDKDRISIKRGTPLALHFPFKRIKTKFSVHNYNYGEGAQHLDNKSFMVSSTKFLNSYRSITKNFL